MKVTIISIPVLDQEKALKFYTEKLGFLKKKDAALDGGHRWITLVSPEAQEGPELLLEPGPLHFEPCKVFQDSLKEAGMPWTQFDVADLDSEYERLVNLGVQFSMKPTTMGVVKVAVLDDTCGNFIQLVENL